VRAIRGLVLLGLFGAVAPAQHWVVEQVDSTGWGSGVQMRRHSDGRMLLCYRHATTGAVRLAWKDTLWRYEDVPVRPAGPGPMSFAAGPHGELGVGYGDMSGAWYSLWSDTGWIHTALPEPAPTDFATFPSAFDTAGQALALVRLDMMLGLARLRDTMWAVTDTIDQAFRGNFLPVQLGVRTDGRAWGVYILSVRDVGVDWEGIYEFSWDGAWVTSMLQGGDFARFGAAAGDVDSAGELCSCYWSNGVGGDSGFSYDGTTLDPGRVALSALRHDLLDRPLVAYVLGSELRFCFRDGRGWHFYSPGVTGVSSVDVMPGPDGQPLIAYATSQGVFTARGENITGIEENQPPIARTMRPASTVVRGVLRIGDRRQNTGYRAELLDIAGRKVMELVPGANDVRQLAPGVYFVRGPSRAGKVVLAK
jgi:hypothetical protein